MYLVFQSLPYQGASPVPTCIRTSTIRSIAGTKPWAPNKVMLCINAQTVHYATEYREAQTLDEAAKMLVHAQAHGELPAHAPSSLETRISTILASGKRPTKTQLRKALDGF